MAFSCFLQSKDLHFCLNRLDAMGKTQVLRLRSAEEPAELRSG